MILLAFFSNISASDLIVILVLVLVLFGAKKLPALARGMGQAVKEFRKAKNEVSDEMQPAAVPRPAGPTPDPAPRTTPAARP